MAGSYQQTIIIGNVGRDPEWKTTQNGVGICDFSVAVTERWNDRNTNERRERTTWYRVTTWRNLAEVCHRYVRKGMSIMVVGTVSASAYIGPDGTARATLDLRADTVQFLSRVEGGEYSNTEYSSGGGGTEYSAGGGYDDYAPPRTSDDIPF